jgi:AcrR family transcriptional regulator
MENIALRADARRNREFVMRAADELFATEGLGVSVQAIAQRAGVGVGTVGRHFATKDDLFSAVVEAGIGRLIELGDELAVTKSPGEAFFDYFTATIRAGARNKAFAETMAETAAKPSGLSEHAGVQKLCDQLERMLTSAQSAGAVRANLSLEDVETLMAACMTRESSLEPVMAAVAAGLRA